jgi:hypothetical protein
MKNRLRIAAAFLAFLVCVPLSAHEFWMMAKPFSPAVGAVTVLTLNVGEYFSGDLIPFAGSQAAALQLYSKAAPRDLREQLPPETALPELPLSFTVPGTYLVAFDSNPTQIILSADKFHAYLHDEGLDAVIRQREEAGTADTPGRERYRRHVKTLLRVGGKSDGTYAALTGQRLEIVPSVDPLAKSAGDTLRFTLFFDSKPLPNALVKAWHKRDGQTVIIRARTGADGKVRFTLPFAGTWMISVVHMIAVTDSPDFDWDSFWGNLTFELAARRGQSAVPD